MFRKSVEFLVVVCVTLQTILQLLLFLLASFKSEIQEVQVCLELTTSPEEWNWIQMKPVYYIR